MCNTVFSHGLLDCRWSFQASTRFQLTLLTGFVKQHITGHTRVEQKALGFVFWCKEQYFLPALPASWATALSCLNCLERGGSVCELMHGWSHTLPAPWECSPHTKTFLFLPKTEFQLNNYQFHNITFEATDAVGIGQFCDSIHSLVTVES